MAVLNGTYDAFAMFRDSASVEAAINRLKAAGFEATNIHTLEPKEFKFGIAKPKFELHTLIRGGALTGAIVGIICGIIFGTLIFYFPPTDGFPQINRISLIGFFAVLGLFFGAAAGTLIGIGVPEKQAKRYARYLGDGGTLVYVRVLDKAQRTLAHDILSESSGFEITFKEETNMLYQVMQGWNYIKQAQAKV